MGTLRRFKGVKGQPGVKCGPKGRQWTPLTQRPPNWCHTWCLICSRVFQFFSLFFRFFHFSFWFLNNNEKCALKIPASEVVQFSKDSDGFFCFFSCQFFFCSLLKKNTFCVFFYQKCTKKNWQIKNWNCHPNRWTNSLLVMRRFLNYAKIHCSFIDRKCRKLW